MYFRKSNLKKKQICICRVVDIFKRFSILVLCLLVWMYVYLGSQFVIELYFYLGVNFFCKFCTSHYFHIDLPAFRHKKSNREIAHAVLGEGIRFPQGANF